MRFLSMVFSFIVNALFILVILISILLAGTATYNTWHRLHKAIKLDPEKWECTRPVTVTGEDGDAPDCMQWTERVFF